MLADDQQRLLDQATDWIAGDPDPADREALEELLAESRFTELSAAMTGALEFGTAGIRGRVGPGPAQMNRAVVIRTTHGVARYLKEGSPGEDAPTVVVGFDARPDSARFAEDVAGVLAASGIAVVYFPTVTPTPLVAFAAKHLEASAAVVVTASHNPPADNGYKVYGRDAAQIVPPVDEIIQREIDLAPRAIDIPRLEAPFGGSHDLISKVPEDIIDRYWREVSTTRSRHKGSDLRLVYTALHGVGGETVIDVLTRAGHHNVDPVATQFEPDGRFPTVDFPNPEEAGALDLAVAQATSAQADLVIANDPDADRFATVVPFGDVWRPLSGNEVGALLADYVLANDPDPSSAIVCSSIVSSPWVVRIATAYGAHHESTLTGFKWIVRAGLALEARGSGRFVFGYEEALGYTVGSTVRDKDGISAALIFTDLAADLRDRGSDLPAQLESLGAEHGLWVSTQKSVSRPGPQGVDDLRRAVDAIASSPPSELEGVEVSEAIDFRTGGSERPPWLGEQALIELRLGERGRILVRPSGTEPKLKVYVDLVEEVAGDFGERRRSLLAFADRLAEALVDQAGL